MEYQKDGNVIVVRVARGEKVVESLAKLVKTEKIDGGYFVGIGATDEVELAHYSVEGKKYSSETFNQPLEITNLTGNIAWFEGEPIVHCHATLSDPQMQCFGGHLVEARISGTLELFLTITDSLKKREDDETGLKLLSLTGNKYLRL